MTTNIRVTPLVSQQTHMSKAGLRSQWSFQLGGARNWIGIRSNRSDAWMALGRLVMARLILVSSYADARVCGADRPPYVETESSFHFLTIPCVGPVRGPIPSHDKLGGRIILTMKPGGDYTNMVCIPSSEGRGATAIIRAETSDVDKAS